MKQWVLTGLAIFVLILAIVSLFWDPRVLALKKSINHDAFWYGVFKITDQWLPAAFSSELKYLVRGWGPSFFFRKISFPGTLRKWFPFLFPPRTPPSSKTPFPLRLHEVYP